MGKWNITSTTINGTTISGVDMAGMTWEFYEDGRAILQTPGDPIPGKWAIPEVGKLTLSEGAATFHFSGEDTLEIAVSGGAKYQLSRSVK